jgi:hypothetical protein
VEQAERYVAISLGYSEVVASREDEAGGIPETEYWGSSEISPALKAGGCRSQFRVGCNPISSILRIYDAMQVEGWRRHLGLTQHYVNLPSMVRLVIEQMTACHVRSFHVVFAFIIRVRERLIPKSGIEPRKERLDPRVLLRPSASQARKVFVQNLV